MGARTKRRAAIVLDIENLVHEHWQTGAFDAAVDRIAAIVDFIAARATIVSCVAVCDTSLARGIAVPLAAHGVRVHVHHGGPDAADRCLAERLHTDVPSSCDLVVIASGDHFFCDSVGELRERGRRVEVASRRHHVARELRRAADAFIDLDALVPASVAA